jgi:hypothetical protein
MKVFNIANLLAPTQVAKVFTGGYGYMAAVAGNYCYVASEATGVRTLNISNPSTPVEVGYYDGVPQSRGVAANGQYVYVAEKIDGLSIYSNDLATAVENQASLPREFSLDQNFPNPFNPTTQISYSIPHSGLVSLKVYTLLGQEVATLFTGMRPAGTYVSTFHGSGLASGIYIYRLSVKLESGASLMDSKKLLLMK